MYPEWRSWHAAMPRGMTHGQLFWILKKVLVGITTNVGRRTGDVYIGFVFARLWADDLSLWQTRVSDDKVDLDKRRKSGGAEAVSFQLFVIETIRDGAAID